MRRPRGTGRIYQQKGSSIWWIKFYRNGEPFRESTGTSDKRKAIRALNLRLAEVTIGKFVGPQIERILISELAEDLLRDYRINGKSSIDDAESRWELHLKPFFGSLRATQVTSSLVNRYVDLRLNEGAKNATINRELAALKRMFNLGRKTTPPKVIFVPAFPRLAENNIRKGFLEDAQYEKLLESCLEIWFQTLVEMAATYGWRVSELLGLRVNQVDLANWTIRLHPGTTKNKEGREVKMTKIAQDLLELCIEGKGPNDYVFTRSSGKRVKDFRGAWWKAREAAGVPNLLFHDFRRTAARNYRRAGIAEGVIMKIGGWKTRSVFERYAIVSNSDVDDAVERYEARRERLKSESEQQGKQAGT
ncbi:MAG TPA: site-specific integrase [Bryobacteraceae bacterium]|jgi:integrase